MSIIDQLQPHYDEYRVLSRIGLCNQVLTIEDSYSNLTSIGFVDGHPVLFGVFVFHFLNRTFTSGRGEMTDDLNYKQKRLETQLGIRKPKTEFQKSVGSNSLFGNGNTKKSIFSSGLFSSVSQNSSLPPEVKPEKITEKICKMVETQCGAATLGEAKTNVTRLYAELYENYQDSLKAPVRIQGSLKC